MARTSVIFLLILLQSAALAQSVPDSTRKSIFSLALRGHYGYLLKHSSEFEFKESYPFGFEADLGWQLITDKAYRFCSCYPRVGLSVNYFNFDNGPVLGSAYYTYVYVEPVFFVPRRFNLSFRIGLLGLAFMDRPYDEANNPTNLAYSTNVAFPLVLGIGFNYRVTDRWNIRIGGNYNHISNGGIRNPNKGLNYPTGHVGVEYTFRPVALAARGRMRRPPPEKKNRFELDVGNALKNASAKSPAQFWVLNVSAQYARWFHRSSAVAGGATWEMDISRRVRILQSDDPTRSHHRASVYVGHEFWLGKIQFGQYVGVYAFDDFPETARWYHRHELTFHLTPWLFVGAGLKAHYQVADFLDLKVGYAFGWAGKKKAVKSPNPENN